MVISVDWMTLALLASILFLWFQLQNSKRYIKIQAHVSENKRSGESAVVTSRENIQVLEFRNIKSLADSFIQAVQKYRQKEYIRVKESGNWKSFTYDQVYVQAQRFGNGLLEYVEPSQEFQGLEIDLSGSMVGIYMQNSYYWVLTDHACSLNSLVSVPIHASFGKDGLEAVLNHSKLTVLVTVKDKLPEVLGLKPQYLKVLVVLEGLSKDDLNFQTDLRIISIQDLIIEKNKENVLPTRDHVFTVCYTSGTTGDPKGVVLTHGNMIEAGKGLLKVVPEDLMPGVEDSHLSFLPMSHIFERMNTHGIFLD